MKPGKLDQRVAIRRETLTADGMGGSTEAVATIATLWARVQIVGGEEKQGEDRVSASAKYLFTFRNNSTARGITAKDRLQWGGADYNIRVIEDEGSRAMYLTISAERGVAQ